MKYAVLLAALLVMCTSCVAQFNGEAFKHASVAYMVKDLETGKVLESKNADVSMTPASILKLLTTATAFEVFGAHKQFVTTLNRTGTMAQKGTLNGDIVIKGGGDPTSGSRYFTDNPYEFLDKWVGQIVLDGIKHINGDVKADVSLFYPEPLPPKWIWEDIGNYYGSGAYAINGFDNLYTIYFDAAKIGQKARVSRIEPDFKTIKFAVEAVGSRNPKDSAYVFGGPFDTDKIIRGSIPSNKMDFSIKGSMPNPPLLIADLLLQRLKKAGITVSGTAKVSYEPIPGLHQIDETASPNLADIAGIVNKNSNNLFAEQLFRNLSPGLDYAGISGFVKEFWQQKGLKTASCFVYDGSGLSPLNGLSPKFMTELLEYMAVRSPWNTDFLESLPVAGQNGTVKYFMVNQNKASVFVKSGSMNHTRCYAGYIKKNGRMYAFTVMLNRFNGPQKEAVVSVEQWLNNVIDKL